MKSRVIHFLILALVILVSACSTVSKPTSSVPRQYHQQIDMSGRLSVQYEQNNKPQAVHINFSWAQTVRQTTVTLISPTGQTLATLITDAQGAQLVQANKPTQLASDANQLMLTMLGWPLPIDGLHYWLQGFMDETHSISASHANDTYLIADGWNITYPTWVTENNVERPKRIDLQRQTEQAGLVSLRIVIDEWNAR